MKTALTLLCGLMLLLCALPSLAQGGKPAKSPLRGEYAEMVKVVNLNQEQQAKLTEKVVAMQAAVRAWDTQNKDAVSKLNADIKAATEAGDKAKVNELRAQLKQLTDAKTAISAQYRKEIMEIMTPEQRDAWAVHLLQKDVARHFRLAKLTAEQLAKARPLCEAALKEINALPATDTRGNARVRAKLFADVAAQVLTDDQRATLKAAAEAAKAKKEQQKKK